MARLNRSSHSIRATRLAGALTATAAILLASTAIRLGLWRRWGRRDAAHSERGPPQQHDGVHRLPERCCGDAVVLALRHRPQRRHVLLREHPVEPRRHDVRVQGFADHPQRQADRQCLHPSARRLHPFGPTDVGIIGQHHAFLALEVWHFNLSGTCPGSRRPPRRRRRQRPQFPRPPRRRRIRRRCRRRPPRRRSRRRPPPRRCRRPRLDDDAGDDHHADHGAHDRHHGGSDVILRGSAGGGRAGATSQAGRDRP